ncbi:MAG: hypothetical protein LBN95_12005 [Prevotellaceae bacterium]|jgi:hypothetical protein|nr:hypothetical protein [Prevotellaceae bacterium]
MSKKLFDNFTQISSLSNLEKFVVGRNPDGKVMYALIEQLGIDNIRAIAEGRFNAIVFADSTQLQAWFSGDFTRPDNIVPSDLVIGQNIYLESLDEDDYWVSILPATSINDLSVLPDDKIDLSNYVEKIPGKGLSTNDYTTSEKQKLYGIESGAQVNPNIVAVLNLNSDTVALAASQAGVLVNMITYKVQSFPVQNIASPGYFKIATGLKLADFSFASTVTIDQTVSNIIFSSNTMDLNAGGTLTYTMSIESGFIYICGYSTFVLNGTFFLYFRLN